MAESKSRNRRGSSKDEPQQKAAEEDQAQEQEPQQQETVDDASARAAAPLSPDEDEQQPQREEAAKGGTVAAQEPEEGEPVPHRANRPASQSAPLEAPEGKQEGQEAFVPPQVTNTASGLAPANGEKSRIVVKGTDEAPDPDELFSEVGGDGMVTCQQRIIEHAFAQPYDRKITRVLLTEGSRVIPFHAERIKTRIREQRDEEKDAS